MLFFIETDEGKTSLWQHLNRVESGTGANHVDGHIERTASIKVLSRGAVSRSKEEDGCDQNSRRAGGRGVENEK